MPKDFSLNLRILKSNMKVFAPYYNLDSDEGNIAYYTFKVTILYAVSTITCFCVAEIVENILGSVMLIGINLPQQKNILTESALDKLNRCVQKFNITNDIIVAVLHGCGGNFCTGVETNKNTTLKSKELIKVIENFFLFFAK